MKKTTRGVRSMTGYGAAAEAITGGRLTIELRSVNQRFLDVRVTAPREYAPWEATCRELVGKHVARGRVEVYISRQAPARGRTRVVLNVDAARDYFRKWLEIEPAASLDPVTTSPKILAVFKEVAEEAADARE